MEKNNTGYSTNSRVGRTRHKKSKRKDESSLPDNFIMGMTNQTRDDFD